MAREEIGSSTANYTSSFSHNEFVPPEAMVFQKTLPTMTMFLSLASEAIMDPVVPALDLCFLHNNT